MRLLRKRRRADRVCRQRAQAPAGSHPGRPRAPLGRGGRGRGLAGALVGDRRPGRDRGPRSCSLHLVALPERHGQQLLRRRGQERDRQLEGLLLRVARPRFVHHRGQTPAASVAHGSLRTPLRLLQLEHAAAAGPGRGGLGPGPSSSGPALAGGGGGAAGGPRFRLDPGRRPDLPLQQPRRATHPAAPAGRVGSVVGDREGVHLEAGCRRGGTGLRLPHQDADGLPGAAGSGPRLPCVCAAAPGAPLPAAARSPWRAGRLRRLVDSRGRAVAR